MALAAGEAAALRKLADRLESLPAYSARNPHAWHEGKSDLVAALRELAAPTPPRAPARAPATPAPRRAAFQRSSVESVRDREGRTVPVVRRRARAFTT